MGDQKADNEILPQRLRLIHLLPGLILGLVTILFLDLRVLSSETNTPKSFLLTLAGACTLGYISIYGLVVLARGMRDAPFAEFQFEQSPLIVHILASNFAYYALFAGRVTCLAIFEATCLVIAFFNMGANVTAENAGIWIVCSGASAAVMHLIYEVVIDAVHKRGS